MIDPASRYATTEIATAQVPDPTGGTREVRCLRRRFLPPSGGSQTLALHTVARGDRPDLVAAAYLGDPTLFWRVCDAALVIHPDELTADDRIGGTVRVPFPQP
ncbi:hypothetical protein ACFV2H_01025 [Streptomyces sp. NPDC059629]|uniref:hypothetical protein n=1 Tax=Streptomyces sp. NPDC059629 TaxID=3346889 RepID=UPI00368B109E